jgi:hypothetical protein
VIAFEGNHYLAFPSRESASFRKNGMAIDQIDFAT